MPALSLDYLRRYAAGRSLFAPTTLPRAIDKLGFVQADPIRAPARAQDLTLRHRVRDYRAGDLERRYPKLEVEEDFFINYGFLPRAQHALMHPRSATRPWDATTQKRAQAILEFVREQGSAHPRDVEARFGHGSVKNYWGGSSRATTFLLDGMHYRGMLRVLRREQGARIYTVLEFPARRSSPAERRAQLDALVDLVVAKYAPVPAPSLGPLIGRLRYAAPQWTDDLRPALARAKTRLSHARVDGVDWYWPAGERPTSSRYARPESVRLLAPFDPVAWDRRRFELFWDFRYRFEAYTPPEKRKLGYYALPLLWNDRVVGWANATYDGEHLTSDLGFIGARPDTRVFERELEAELARLEAFLK
jgi:uncharacterized protein YcaQ